jgi:hypothetical protein
MSIIIFILTPVIQVCMNFKLSETFSYPPIQLNATGPERGYNEINGDLRGYQMNSIFPPLFSKTYVLI